MSTPLPKSEGEETLLTPDKWDAFVPVNPVPPPDSFSPLKSTGANSVADIKPPTLFGGADSPGAAVTDADISCLVETLVNPNSPARQL